jgi:superfamily II DNA or RNA helicase
MRAGAVGINLTQANRVFIMEPCFNPALEAQAVGRVHRLGQTRNVEIIRLIMENSVESRMVQMLDKKYSRVAASNDSNEEIAQVDSEEGKDKKPAATSTEDKKPAATSNVAMIGSLKSDKTVVMEDEFDLLFGVESANL